MHILIKCIYLQCQFSKSKELKPTVHALPLRQQNGMETEPYQYRGQIEMCDLKQ